MEMESYEGIVLNKIIHTTLNYRIRRKYSERISVRYNDNKLD